MATSNEYKDFILKQLDLLENVTCKAIMGEFYIIRLFYLVGFMTIDYFKNS